MKLSEIVTPNRKYFKSIGQRTKKVQMIKKFGGRKSRWTFPLRRTFLKVFNDIIVEFHPTLKCTLYIHTSKEPLRRSRINIEKKQGKVGIFSEMDRTGCRYCM